MKELTQRQNEIFDFICRHKIEKGFAPVVKEISAHFGFTETAAWHYLNVLQKKGFISWKKTGEKHSPRGIQILKLNDIFHGTLGELPIQIAPVGTAKYHTEGTQNEPRHQIA